MYSLLTEELNRTRNLGKTDTYINNSQFIESKELNKQNECSLNIHTFDPTKNSPPNDWQQRLKKRINYHKSLQITTNY